jgi:putative transposon-encoded protein
MKRIPITPETDLRIKNIRGFYIKKVTRFGTSAKVDCPKEHLGKTVYLVILNHDDE